MEMTGDNIDWMAEINITVFQNYEGGNIVLELYIFLKTHHQSMFETFLMACGS